MKRLSHYWLAVVLLCFLTGLTAFFMIYKNPAFYDRAFAEFGVYDHLGREVVDEFHPHILRFLTSNLLDDTFPSSISEYLDPSEKSHLVDVKHLLTAFRIGYYVAAAAFLGFVVYFVRKKEFRTLGQVMVDSALVSLALLILAFAGSLFFEKFFTIFHNVFFPMGNYEFPPTSLLVQLYPEALFQMAFETILATVFLSVVILAVFGYLLRKMARS